MTEKNIIKHEKRIAEFYKGKHVFITGGTGFMGKLLIEKLLRSCPDIGAVYILIRPKKGKNLSERLKQLTSDQLYERLKSERPGNIETKLKALEGDLTQLELGLSPADRQMLVEKINVIFHVAASVRFDDPLKDAVLLNTRGTREVSQLALDTKHLEVLVQISTAYSNCYINKVEEKLYPAPADWRKTIEIVEKCDRDTLVPLTEKFLGSFPNTYTFTKALGEHVVNDMCRGKIPVKLCRPSIVISTMEEPVEGWIDNFNGPVGLLVACGKGIMRTSYQDPNIAADYIPVDVAIRSIVVASWDLALRQNKHEVEVLHCSSGYHKWVTIGELINMGKMICHKIPLNDILWVPKGYVSKSRTLAYLKTVLFQLIPALVLDLVLKIKGQKAILTKLQKKIFIASCTLRYFTFREWNFDNNNLFIIEDRILQEDRDDWAYDFRDRDVEEYVQKCILGSRRYLLNEPDETLPQAKRHYKRMLWLDRITTALFYIFCIWLIFKLELPAMFGEKIDRLSNRIFTLEE